ncbi:MFS general substrate transporter [Xylona heveae TC161]|uniref:MFS general substrate transporter n=1 Tax=Xylona heveae (strain CBS 132557 / TC161) TaxID=1328760 RepID=A0A165JFQ6_XYLHT|nr:MFS general substrate transporter [Xylona heveae TC161]KZF26176.1 MFS general substrate transporter [Xylona heveae TC161]
MAPAGPNDDAKNWQMKGTTNKQKDSNPREEYFGEESQTSCVDSGPSGDASSSTISSIRLADQSKWARDREPSLESYDHDAPERRKHARHVSFDVQSDPSEEPDDVLPTINNRPAKVNENEKPGPVTWASLPRKGQLLLLVLARMSEPLAQNSLAAYVFYQLRSFDPSLPDSTISSQAGILQGSFAAAQFLTAVLWGRVSDADWGGRKRVLLIGLFGTTLASIGFGFSKSFASAITFRILGGVLNGNVGVLRTMISEIIKEKKYQSRAFLLLPMCFNIGVIIGPIIGGCLADPVEAYPHIFGPNSILGGKSGVRWMMKWPYALPNLISAIFLFISAFAVFLGLEETLESRLHKPDYGLRLGKFLSRTLRRIAAPLSPASTEGYSALSRDEHSEFYTGGHARQLSYVSSRGPSESIDLERSPAASWTTTPKMDGTSTADPHNSPRSPPRRKRKLPFRRIWTRNVLFTLLAHFILGWHLGTFNNLWYTFLSTPRADNSSHHNHSSSSPLKKFFFFTGGLGMPPRSVGLAMAILGAMGIVLQLGVYPTITHKFGTIFCYRIFLLLFPFAYTLAPFLALVPSPSTPTSSTSSLLSRNLSSSLPAPSLPRTTDPQADAEHHRQGILVWLAISVVLLIQVLGRTFTLPATNILVNNCSPHPSVLGTIHGIGQSVSSGARSLGPAIGGWLYGLGLRHGIVGAVWWGLSGVAIVGWVVSGLVYEGSGHEISLEGEEEEEGAAQSNEGVR